MPGTTNYESDFDEDIGSESDDIGDSKLLDDIDAEVEAMNATEEMEAMSGSDMEDPDLDDDAADVDGSDDEPGYELEEDGKGAEPDLIGDPEAEPDLSITPDVIAQHNDHVQICELKRACDSRQPDIPTQFELTATIISRACSLAAGNAPMVETSNRNPGDIARIEMSRGKSLRSILRGDTVWRIRDFNCLPNGYANEFDTADRLHELQ